MDRYLNFTAFQAVARIGSFSAAAREMGFAAEYLSRRGAPSHPCDLVNHDTLGFIPTGNAWAFDQRHGPIRVKQRLTSNDGRMLVSAAAMARCHLRSFAWAGGRL